LDHDSGDVTAATKEMSLLALVASPNKHFVNFLRLQKLAVTHEARVHEKMILDPCKCTGQMVKSAN
jgi:hypothetical protein